MVFAATTFQSRLFKAPAVSALLIAFLAGCAVGPDYVPPRISAPARWDAELGGGLSAGEPDSKMLVNWWFTFNDPVLADLIEQARTSNLDVREALSRIRAARANVTISRAGLFPTLGSSGSRSYSRSSKSTGSGTESDLYSIGLDASWELDIFGGVRRSVEASRADLEASEADLNDVLITLLAEVALNYIDTRTLQSRLFVAESNLTTQEETYQLVVARNDAGLASQLDVEEAKYNLENTRSRIPSLRSELDQSKNRIAILLGIPPGAVDDNLSTREPIPVVPLEVAVGVPAEALRRRPDIRRAERRVAAETALIGVATSELYPKFQLAGSIGLDAFSFNDLFPLSGSYSYRYGPSFSWPIFTAGRIRQSIEVQNALTEQALIQYERTILTALEEVESALISYAQEQIRRQALDEASQAALRAADLAETQYSSGLVDFQTVLDAQRSLLSFQEQLTISEGEIISNLIRLYKALGGGWTPLASAETITGGGS